MQLSDEELTIAATRELARASGTCLNLKLAISEAMGLLGTIQLAMRHPDYGETARSAMREVASRIERQLSRVGPAMAEMAARGWNPDHDTGWNS
jgi:hypothetical protein